MNSAIPVQTGQAAGSRCRTSTRSPLAASQLVAELVPDMRGRRKP